MSFRVRSHKSGSSTVSGINRHDLGEILTAAAIHCHEQRRKNPEHDAYHKGLLTVIDAMTDALKSETRRLNGDTTVEVPLASLSKEERQDRLNRSKAERAYMDRIMGAMRKCVQEARAKKDLA